MGHPNYYREADESKPAHISDSGWDAPRLGIALKNAPAGKVAAYRTKVEQADPERKSRITLADFDKELPKLLGHIEERLTLGVGEAWVSKYGYGYRADEGKDIPFNDLRDSTVFMDEPEERWATAFCEQFVFMMYHTPGHVHGAPGRDRPFFEYFDKYGYFPIALACQTLSTYGVLTRGFPLSAVSTAYAAGLGCTVGSIGFKDVFDQSKNLRKAQETPSSVPMPPAPAKDATAEEKKTYLEQVKVASAERQKDLKAKGDRGENRKGACSFANTQALVKAGFTPGSVVVYNAGGVDYTSQDIECPQGIVNAHIATALRVSGQRIQWIDTGVVTGNSKESMGEGGTSDHSFLEGSLTSPTTVIAAGVMKTPGKDTLLEYAKKTAAAKPLGVTRLVIVRTASNEVAFVSKLLHMRWPISHLLWSLRDLPVEGLTVAWFVYSAYDVAACEALMQNPTKPPSALLGDGVKHYLTNVLISHDGDVQAGGVDVYRTRMWQNWRLDFSGNKIPIPKVAPAYKDTDALHTWAPGRATDWKVAGDSPAPLWEWCPRAGNRGKRYVRKTLGGAVTIDEEKTGSPLVDPDG